LLLCCGGVCWAISITATGSWSRTISASDLTAGAGSDLISTYESASDAISIDIIASLKYRVDVSKVDGNWHSNLQLFVKRTTSGTGGSGSSVSGGTSYQQVTGIATSFFSGQRNRSNVKIQLKLTGASIQVPPAVYTTTVYYTVTDI